jgi:DNA polymerase-1
MVQLAKRIQKDFEEAEIVLTVHDELVCEVPLARSKSLARVMKEIMEEVFVLDVPIEVEVGIGANWRDMKYET